VKLGSTITTILLARPIQGFIWNLPPNSPCNNDLIESSKTDPFCTLTLVARTKPRLAKAMYTKHTTLCNMSCINNWFCYMRQVLVVLFVLCHMNIALIIGFVFFS